MMVAMGFSPWCGRQCSPRRGATPDSPHFIAECNVHGRIQVSLRPLKIGREDNPLW
jgi:hypothetical protein